jgi:hypothetical protein
MMIVLEQERWWWVEQAEKLGYTLYAKERQRLFDAPKTPPSPWDLHAED